MDFPLKSNIDIKADLTKIIMPFVGTANKGLQKLGSLLFGKMIVTRERDSALIEAQTEHDTSKILAGKARYENGTVVSIKNYETLSETIARNKMHAAALMIDNITRQEFDNFTETLSMVVEKVSKLDNAQVSDEALDASFFLRWRREASLTSQPELKDLLANLLTENIKESNSISLRTLDVAKTLTSEDAKNFSCILPYVASNKAFLYSTRKKIYPPIIDFETLIQLDEAGLIKNFDNAQLKSREISYNYTIRDAVVINDYVFADLSSARGQFGYDIIPLTQAGIEILSASVIEAPSKEQIKLIITYLSVFMKDAGTYNPKIEVLTLQNNKLVPYTPKD